MAKGSLSIGEVAARAGVGIDTVRYYERRGVLPPAERRSSGYRVFKPQTVERIIFVKELQTLGFSLDELVALLRLVDTNTASCESARGYAVATLDRIDAKIKALSITRNQLASILDGCNSGTCAQLAEVTPLVRLPLAPSRSATSARLAARRAT
jgi:DNA-binding transcriptional MerR regulator